VNVLTRAVFAGDKMTDILQNLTLWALSTWELCRIHVTSWNENQSHWVFWLQWLILRRSVNYAVFRVQLRFSHQVNTDTDVIVWSE